MAKQKNKNLNAAKRNKNDEFYTRLTDIEKELKHYKKHFKGKVVYCNCDDPRVSNFFHYFSYNFERLGLKKLITTCYKNSNINSISENADSQAVYLEYSGDKNGNNVPDLEEIEVKPLKGDGDFRSAESIELLEKSDIIISNPPFSLFREYLAQIINHKKKFLIIGNMNAITYKEIFPLIRDNKMWAGHKAFSGGMDMIMPKHSFDPGKIKKYSIDDDGNIIANIMGVIWFTNLDIKKRHENMILYKQYNPKEYPKYDNYDAIDVSKVSDIPIDYDGVMGVPITFLDKHNPAQFELLGCNRGVGQDPERIYGRGSYINGKETFKRLFIRKIDKNKQVK